MQTFSQEFLSIFPSIRSYHSHCVCICNYSGHMLTPLQKICICKEIMNNNVPIKTIADFLQISRRRIDKLFTQYKQGYRFFESTGRPSRIDDIGLESISEEISNAAETRNPLKKSQAVELVRNTVIESDIRRGSHGLNSSIGTTTIKKVLNEIDVSFEKGQTITNARDREKKDIRNMLSMAVMNEALAKDKPPQ